jgi:hypothetical protein
MSFLETTPELPIQKWFPPYIKAFFVLARTFEPGDNVSVDESIRHMHNFIINTINLMPQRIISERCKDFIQMKPYVVQTIIDNCSSFTTAYSNYVEIMKKNPEIFFNTCLQHSQSLFIWVYLLYSFILSTTQGKPKSLNSIRDEYQYDKLSKYDWGRPLWYIIHTSSLYAPEPIKEYSFGCYYEILNSLQYLLPCPKCRNHLRENLKLIPLDSCDRSRENLFRCSVKLHNIVNKSINDEYASQGVRDKTKYKHIYTYEEAIKLYM